MYFAILNIDQVITDNHHKIKSFSKLKEKCWDIATLWRQLTLVLLLGPGDGEAPAHQAGVTVGWIPVRVLWHGVQDTTRTEQAPDNTASTGPDSLPQSHQHAHGIKEERIKILWFSFPGLQRTITSGRCSTLSGSEATKIWCKYNSNNNWKDWKGNLSP